MPAISISIVRWTVSNSRGSRRALPYRISLLDRILLPHGVALSLAGETAQLLLDTLALSRRKLVFVRMSVVSCRWCAEECTHSSSF